MPDSVFADSNIWLYAFMEDKEKKAAASTIISKKTCVLSTQVVNEVCVNLISKAGYGEDDIAKLVENLYNKYQIENIDKHIILKSSMVRSGFDISYWDSLIIASALESGCEVLYSEDMQHNQIIAGELKIINPFKRG